MNNQQPQKMQASISLVMNGIKKCSGSCLYCSAASTMNYRSKDNKTTFVFDKEKTKKRILEYTKDVFDKANGLPVELNVDVWGGNPVENIEPFKQCVDFLENDLKEFAFVHIHTSGNGLELQDKDIVDYLMQHGIHYQLSHDGLGQWLRTGDIDPLYWDKTKDNIALLTREGLLDWINCTLSARNPSFFDNIEYWNKWRDTFKLADKKITIKLNHIYDGTKPIEKKWLGKDNDYIKHGEVIGDLCFHGEVLQNYLHEFRKLSYICMTPGIENNLHFNVFAGYIKGQYDRMKFINEPREAGSCVAFQRGLQDKNFAIDTKGEYCQCNLIDSDSKVHNPTAKQADYCKGCRFEKMAECNPCGSEDFPEKCEYHWWWALTLEETWQVIQLTQNLQAMNNNNNQCNGNECHCKEKGEPVFCVKGYRF